MQSHMLRNTILLILLATASHAVHAQRQLCDLAHGYYHQERYVEAYEAFTKYFATLPREQTYTEEYMNDSKVYHKTIAKLNALREHIFEEAEKMARKGQSAKADSLYCAYLTLCVTKESRETYDYSTALTQNALLKHREGHTDECLRQLQQVVELRDSIPNISRAHTGETHNLIATIEFQRGHYDEAIAACQKAADTYRKYYGAKNESYGTALANMSTYYITRNGPGDRQRAIELGERAIKILPRSHTAYANAISNLVASYSVDGNMAKVQKYTKLARKAMQKAEQGSVDYALMLGSQANQQAQAGNYAQALEYAREAIAIFESTQQTSDLNYARVLSNTATLEKRLEHYKSAIALWEKAAQVYSTIEGENSMGYLDCISEISAVHARTGNLELAASIHDNLTPDVSEKAKKTDDRYAHSLTRRASIMATDGNYQQAIELQRQALPIFRLRKDVADEAKTLNDLSNYLYHAGQLQQAIDTCLLALKLYDTVTGHAEDRALALNSLSIYYYMSQRVADALSTSRQAVELYEQSGNTRSSHFAKVLTNQALFESRSGDLDRAVQISTRADSLQRSILGDLHPDNVILRFNLANYYIKQARTDTAQHLFREALHLQMQHVRSNFSHLTTRGRELYWGTKSFIFRAAPYMACLMEENDSALADAYDALLFTKGLLLNSEVDFRNLLARTASPKLQQTYAELTSIHQQIESAYRNPTEENIAQIPGLTKRATRLERDLIRGCKQYGDFTAAMNITHDQVRRALAPDDAAIEFFDIESNGTERMYWALVARKDWGTPRLVRLFSNRELDAMSFHGSSLTQALTDRDGIRSVFEDPRVGQLVWGNLMPVLEGVRSIWFSPSGMFYHLGIEYLRYADKNISDLYDLHRVSSTKLLLLPEETSSGISQAAVFGGLDYDASPDNLQAAIQQLSELHHDYVSEYMAAAQDDADKSEDMAMADLRTLSGFMRDNRGSVGRLPGTKIEASMIGECLMMNDVDTEMYMDALGTEEAFKQLSGRGVALLHIATHGFALSEDAVKQNHDAIDYLNVSQDEAAQADNSLCYSGLLMSGANNVLLGRAMPNGLENGVLTAREIAQLDFRGLSLAVLSACQTGLGELKEDGVFGLQRGFKKAGARTLLMSLWSVDDEATQVMMSHFYRALVSGQNRRQAFHTAQTALRSTPRFASPFYWASFVMLDD